MVLAQLKENHMVESKRHLYLVDGSGFIFRAFHGLPPMTRSDGTPVNAVYGFSTMLAKMLENHDADHFVVVFDSARKNFRNDIYPEYKAHRAETPPDLIPQFALIREATTAFNVPWIELEGYEADDLIATYARMAVEEGSSVTVVSSDKDLMQLIGGQVTMLDPMKNKKITRDDVMNKFGVGPEKVTEVQALIGDSSDNVPGVPRIGPKTAAELMKQFGSLDEILRRAGEVKQKGRREALIEHADNARLSFKLVTLDQYAPVTNSIDDFAVRAPDPATLLAFIQQNEFKTLTARLQVFLGDIATRDPQIKLAETKQDYTLIQSVDELQKWCVKAKRAGIIAIDTETTSLDPNDALLAGISISIEPGEAAYIPIGHVDAFGKLIDTQIPLTQAAETLRPVLEDLSILKIGQNIKYDSHILHKYGMSMAPIDDTMLLSYVLDAGAHSHGLDYLAKHYFNHDMVKFKDVVGTGKKQILFTQVPLEEATQYAAEDADYTLRLHKILKQRLLDEKMATVYETMERPLIDVLRAMEHRGVRIDPHILDHLHNDFGKRVLALEEKIYTMAGRKFNIGSPKQLGEVLFDELGLTAPKKGKSGSYSTDVDVLEGLAGEGHEIARFVLDWRGLTKLINTYLVALKEQIHLETQRVHTNYGMAITATGRLSSSDPNLQNIPIRTEDGRAIRRAFIAQDGYKLVSFDYSQIELRLLAEVADVTVLKDVFKNGKDIHKRTAAMMFHVDEDNVSDDMRRNAKAINFGIIYGLSAFGLSQQIGCSKKEAGDYIKAYLERYPGIEKYMERTKEFCRKHAYVETLFGRKCHINDINSKNYAMRGFSERAAINAPLQGSNADIIKKAMIRIDEKIRDDELDAHMLLQVHDELIFEIRKEQLDYIVPKIKKIMETVVHLSVPLIVNYGVADNWADAH
jgi:DNA polymerase I